LIYLLTLKIYKIIIYIDGGKDNELVCLCLPYLWNE
jgi:hypothetical protein